MSAIDYRLLAGKRVLCAVSGGADSVYLLHNCAEAMRKNGLIVCAAHFNHCLRGAESDRDERFVQELCAQWDVPCVVGRGDVGGYARQHRLGTEEAARKLRYDFLENTAERLGMDVIATAHNADDNAETLLLALARGTGLRGLGGIPPVRGRIVRPMLGVSRAQVEEYLAGHGLPHVEDSTNASLDYTRNKLRALVMPVLKEINPGFVRAAGRTSELLRADEEFLDGMAQIFLDKYPDGRVDAGELSGLAWSVASRVVRRMAPRALEAAHVGAVLDIAAAGKGEADVPGARFRAEGGALYVVRGGAACLPVRALNIPGETAIPEAGLVLRAEYAGSGREIHTSLNTFYFQCENICGTMYCAARRDGDRLRPAGRGCTKKVKDLFAERGIPASQRALVPVLRDESGLLAVVGFGQDERTIPRSGGRLLVIRALRSGAGTTSNLLHGVGDEV